MAGYQMSSSVPLKSASSAGSSTMSAGSAFSIAGNVFAGTYGLLSSLTEAKSLKEQGKVAQSDYLLQAKLVREEGHRIRAKQTMEYLGSGVDIAGTPQLVLKETLSRAAAKAHSLEITGSNVNTLYRNKARTVRNEGVASLVSNLFSAGATAMGA